MPRRSDCPISNVLDYVGDKWSLLVIRDMLLFGKCTFSDFQDADEHIATNILASRLSQLESDGLIAKEEDPSDRRKKRYTLTPSGRDFLPVLLEMIAWSAKYDPNTNAPKELISRIAQDRESLIHELLNRFNR